MATFRVNWPFGGLSDDAAFTDQPAGTTREAKNVRNIDPTNGRRRGAQRSGQSKFNETRINGSNKVQHLVSAINPSPGLSFELLSGGEEVWKETASGGGRTIDIAVDAAGDVYAIEDYNIVVVRNSAGVELHRFSVPLPADGGNPGDTELVSIVLDEFSNIYLASGYRATFVDGPSGDPSPWTASGAGVNIGGTPEDDTRIFRYRRVGQFDGGFTYVQDWAILPDIDPVGASEQIYLPSDLAYDDGNLYVILGGSQSNSEWDAGVYVYTQLGSPTPTLLYFLTEASANAPLPWGTGGQRISPAGGGVYWAAHFDAFFASDSYLIKRKIDDIGVEINIGGDSTGAPGGGFFRFGYGLVYNRVHNLVHALTRPTTDATAQTVLTFDDNGDFVWATEIAADLQGPTGFMREHRVSMVVDANGHLYLPIYTQETNNAEKAAVVVLNGLDGSEIIKYTPPEHETIAADTYNAVALAPVPDAFTEISSGDNNFIDEPFDWSNTTFWTAVDGVTTGSGPPGPIAGDNTVSLISDAGGGATSHVEFSKPVNVLGPRYTLSVWAKASDTDADPKAVLRINNVTGGVEVDLDWSWTAGGVPTSISATGSSNIADSGIADSTIDGWYRLYVTLDATGLVTDGLVARLFPSTTGTGSEETFFAAAMFEVHASLQPGPFSNVPIAVTDIYAGSGFGTIFTDLDTAEQSLYATIRRIRLVETKLDSTKVREQTYLAVAGGEVKQFSADAINGIPGGGTLDDGGLSPTAQYIDSAAAFGKVFFTDGTNYKVYDVRDGDMEDYKATSTGEIPRNGRLMTVWGGRIVLARFAEAADNWAMSAIADPFNWDFFPDRRSPASAVNGPTAIHAGAVGDAINALIPINDDLMLVLCDRSIFRFTGNPMDRGQIDLVSDITGGSFGKCWTKDPKGNVYFIGSRGRFYAIPAGGAIPQPLSEHTIDERLESVNLGTYRFHLEYNYEDRGIHIWVIPYDVHDSVVQHWFFDVKHGAIWEDEINLSTKQPTAVLVADGDAEDDRRMLLGGQDGFVRTWDSAAVTDDGTNIDSLVLMGPSQPAGEVRETRIMSPTCVMATDQSGVNYELFVENEPESLGTPIAQGKFYPGRNATRPDRGRGIYTYVRLRNAAAERWAFESLYLRASSAGRRRINA